MTGKDSSDQRFYAVQKAFVRFMRSKSTLATLGAALIIPGFGLVVFSFVESLVVRRLGAIFTASTSVVEIGPAAPFLGFALLLGGIVLVITTGHHD